MKGLRTCVFLSLATCFVVGQTPLQTSFEGYADDATFDLPQWKKEGFNAPWVDGFDQNRAAIDYSFAHSGNASLRVSYPKGGVGPSQTGVQAPLQLAPATQYYVSYWLRFSDDFSWGTTNEGGKLPGLASGQNCSGCTTCTGTNGFSARLMWRKGGKAVLYLYDMDKKESCGDDYALKTPAKTDFVFQKGQWYQVVERVKVNTAANHDGEVEVWLNGQSAIQVNGLQFVNNGDKVDNFYFSTFHGGSDATWAPKNDCAIWFDDVVVSTQPNDVFAPLSLPNEDSEKANRTIGIVPEPLVSGAYFNLRSPDRSLIKAIDLIDMDGNRVNATEITFSKMGLYLPKVPKGMYLLRIHLEDDMLVKKVYVE